MFAIFLRPLDLLSPFIRQCLFSRVEMTFDGSLRSEIQLRARYQNYYRINHIYDGSEIYFKIYLQFSQIMMCVSCGGPLHDSKWDALNPTFSHSIYTSENVLPTSSKIVDGGGNQKTSPFLFFHPKRSHHIFETGFRPPCH